MNLVKKTFAKHGKCKIPFYSADLVREGENIVIRAKVGSAYHVISGPDKGKGNVVFMTDVYTVVEEHFGFCAIVKEVV